MVKFTTKLSVIIQLVIGIISTSGTFLKVDNKHKILTQILIAENIVQYVELSFYLYFLKQFNVLSLSDMTSIRYYDWVFTTPAMLLTTVIYLKYEEHIQQGKPEILNFFEVLKQEQGSIIQICLCNFFMLLFGYLGEKNIIDRKIGITIGFVFFALTFNLIYSYAVKSTIGKKLFSVLLPIWGLYGVGACLDDTSKNNMFNILDIISKNFFSLYIVYKLKNVSK